MTTYVLSCPAIITIDANYRPECAAGWVLTSVEEPFDFTQISPVDIAGVVGAGFFVLLPLWAAVYGFSALIKTVSRRYS